MSSWHASKMLLLAGHANGVPGITLPEAISGQLGCAQAQNIAFSDMSLPIFSL